MMGVKGGTQTWSTAPQKVDYKSDNAQHISANDKDKFFDGEAIGDTLNKVADPHFDAGKKPRAVGNSELGKDAFMTLLLTQMKNQDPTNPLKSHEMAAQLAQFTSLEKLNNINESLGQLRKDNQPDHNFQALAMIGKVVTMDNSKIPHNDTAETHDLRFALPSDSQKTTITVKDAAGNPVRTLEVKGLKAGANQLVWNGKTDDGGTAPIGDYTLSVDAYGSNGKKLYVQTKAEGMITGVNFTAQGAQLMMGKQVIPMSDVKSISDPKVQANTQPLSAAAGLSGAPMAMGGHPVGLPPGLPPELAAAINAQMNASAGGASEAAPAAAPTPAPTPAARPAMMPVPGASAAAAEAPAQGPRKVEVKPELKGNAAKRASLSKGNIADAAMSQGLINHLNKEGAKAGGMSGT